MTEDSKESEFELDDWSSYDRVPSENKYSKIIQDFAHTPEALVLRPGDVIDASFELLEVIDKGGMGVVWEAWDIHLRRTVALKTIRPEKFDDAYAQLFVREALAMARLRHPNIIVIHSANSAPVPYMVMEYLRGQNLAVYIKEKGELSPKEAVQMATVIVQAVDCAHKNGVVHRDLKPSNVFIEENGNIKVMDFGLAKIDTDRSSMLSAMQIKREEVSAILGKTPAYGGTEAYMSPEQWNGLPQDGRVDVWAVGMLLFEMVVGRPPILHSPGSRDSVRRPSYPSVKPPRSLKRVIERCLQLEPDDRYSDAEALLQALKALEGKLEAPTRWPLVTVAAVVVCTVLFGVGSMVWDRSPVVIESEPAVSATSADEVDNAQRPLVETKAVTTAQELLEEPTLKLEPPERPATSAATASPEDKPAPAARKAKGAPKRNRPATTAPRSKKGLDLELNRLKRN